jgi:hypothetical protein
MSRSKAYFAAVPARAYLDRRLDGGRRDLLGAIALHDRLGTGQGCWASARRLAEFTGLQPATIRHYLGDLAEWGYLERRPDENNKNRRALFVIYDAEQDHPAMKGVRSTAHPEPQGVLSNDTKVCSPVTRERKVEKEIAQSAENEIPQKRPRSFLNGADNVDYELSAIADELAQDAKFLRETDRWLKAQPTRPYDAADLATIQRMHNRCMEIWEQHDIEDPLAQWANRLAGETQWALQEHGAW